MTAAGRTGTVEVYAWIGHCRRSQSPPKFQAGARPPHRKADTASFNRLGPWAIDRASFSLRDYPANVLSERSTGSQSSSPS
jgi:hypothetical protein